MKRRIYIFAFLLAFTIFFIACQNNSKSVLANTAPDRKKIAEFYNPVIYDSVPSGDGQWGFQTVASDKLRVKLVPNIKSCESLGLDHIDSIFGVNQFLLDMDLTSGFVHPYTVNFFNRLSADDLVLKYEKINGKHWEGFISFVRKKDLTPEDTLGKNVAYFREWRLSEMVKHDSVDMQPCSFAKECFCPQAENNAFKEIALANCGGKTGRYPVSRFSQLNNFEGGTVCIIWEDSLSGKIFFKDVHGSLASIISEAKNIATTEQVDPVIAISDAGIVSRKFRAEKFVLDLTPIKKLAPHALIAAGYGYVPVKYEIYEIYEAGKPVRLDTVRTEKF